MRALLTGATHGIGEATAASPLSGRRRPRASRAEPEERVEPSLYELRERNPSTDIVYLPADYGRLADVADFAAAVRARLRGLELLMNNVGRLGPPSRTLSGNGAHSLH